MSKKQPLKQNRKEVILHYYELAMNNSEIAQRAGCSRENVRQVLNLFGLYSHYGKGRPRKKA